MSKFWSNTLDKLEPYTPGEQPKLDNLVKLNTNENPYGPSPKVLEAIKSAATSDLRKYPDPTASSLKHAAAEFYQLTSDQVFVANSSDEVLAHAFRALLQKGKPILSPDISYSFYPVWANLFDVKIKTIPLMEDFSINVNDYTLDNGGIILANPNAPTGLALNKKEIETLLKNNSESVVIIDEAYVDFSDFSAVSLIDQYANLLVTQTLSKSRSLAGLRVGLALGNEVLIEGLERVKNSFHPYSLDALALAGAEASFKDVNYFNETCKRVITTRENTARELIGLGFEVLPSSANFIFVKHNDHYASQLFDELREQGIVVRYFNAPRISDYLRISIGTDAEMKTLLDALNKLLS